MCLFCSFRLRCSCLGWWLCLNTDCIWFILGCHSFLKLQIQPYVNTTELRKAGNFVQQEETCTRWQEVLTSERINFSRTTGQSRQRKAEYCMSWRIAAFFLFRPKMWITSLTPPGLNLRKLIITYGSTQIMSQNSCFQHRLQINSPYSG